MSTETDDFEFTTEDLRPRHPDPPPRRPRLPNPAGPSERGTVPCNAPLVVDGVTVGYCERHVKWRHRGRSRGTHRGAHRIEWWT